MFRNACRYSDYFRSFVRQARAQYECHGANVETLTGKSRFRQFAEMFCVGAGPGRLWPEDYYRFWLYDDARFSWRDKFEFMSSWAIPRRLAGNDWAAVADDKLIFGAVAAQLGFKVPEIYAIYHPHRCYGDVPVLRDRVQLKRYLEDELLLPAFVKPIDGYLSESAYIIDRKDVMTGEVSIRDALGVPISVDQFCQTLQGSKFAGWVFQKVVKPHPAMKEICGGRLSTVRFLTVFDQGTTAIRWVIWKIATGNNVVDNTARHGNLVAPVDAETGVVGQPFVGIGPDFREVLAHPDTDKTLIGFQLPCWQEAKSACLGAARCFSGMPLQGWDIAISDEGPLLIEVNRRPSLETPQMVVQRGLAQGAFKDFLRRKSA